MAMELDLDNGLDMDTGLDLDLDNGLTPVLDNPAGGAPVSPAAPAGEDAPAAPAGEDAPAAPAVEDAAETPAKEKEDGMGGLSISEGDLDEVAEDAKQRDIEAQEKLENADENSYESKKRAREDGEDADYGPPSKKSRTEGEDGEEEAGQGTEAEEKATDAEYDEQQKLAEEEIKLSTEFKTLVTEKSMKRSRRAKQDDNLMREREATSDMIDRMENAMQQDDEALQNGKPAIKKLSLLPALHLFLQRRNILEGNFEPSFLSALKSWLAPYPDRSLPNLKIRKCIIAALDKMDLDQDMLMSAQIGRPILLLLKHPEETIDNKRVCKRLIARWSAPIFSDGSSQQQFHNPLARPSPSGAKKQRKKARLKTSGSMLDSALDADEDREGATPRTNRSRYISIRPERVDFNWTNQPKSNWTEEEKKKKESKAELAQRKSRLSGLDSGKKKGLSKSRSLAKLNINKSSL